MRTSYSLLTKLLILALVPGGIGLMVLARNVFILLFLQVGSDAVVNPATLPAMRKQWAPLEPPSEPI